LSLGASERERALAMVQSFGVDQERREAEDVIRRLYLKGCTREEVLERIQADPKLTSPVRREALALASVSVEFCKNLNFTSRSVVRLPGASISAYEHALRQAETACRLAPYEREYRTTLAMARYRLGKYREAIDTLSRTDERNESAVGGPSPADLALLAMAHYRLNEHDRATAALDLLRKVMDGRADTHDDEADRLLHEADELLHRVSR
jgi:tetratricopeptide (TPR) repeat protein